MKIKIRELKGVAILDLEGNIDINSSALVETVGQVLNTKTKLIICNFGGVNLVDYVGVSLLAVIYKNVLNHKGKMILYNIPTHVTNLFSIVGLNRIFHYYQTEKEAFRAIKETEQISTILKEQMRRKFKRIPSKVNIEYRLKFSDQNTFYKGRIINLSADGLFTVSKKTFSVGDLLSARLNLSPEPGVLILDAKVVWLADQEIQPDEFPGMGLEFHNISSQKQKQIIAFIEKNIT
jgi:anti-anti-sigma factor